MAELFPIERLFHPLDSPPGNGELILARINELPSNPLSHSQLNQLMHLSHQAGMTSGFFTYYFLTQPERHPFVVPTSPGPLDNASIQSVEQLRWGLERFALDAAFFFGDFTNAYRKLRDMSFVEIVEYFDDWRKDSESLAIRGPVMPLKEIAISERHLVSETACKTLGPDGFEDLERRLTDAFNSLSRSSSMRALIRKAENTADDKEPDGPAALAMHAYLDEVISSAEELRKFLSDARAKWEATYALALENTNSYLSLCPELDVYVATSMRTAADFRETGEVAERIFASPALTPLHLRWFDPTRSACSGHEDKGLVECLMVALAQAVLYFAGTKSSWGKDAEAAMALSRGTPVVILCPDTEEGNATARMFRDIHPLSRLTDVRFGVAVGAMVTTDERQVPEILRRLFSGEMEYRLERRDSGGFVVREVLSGSAVRTVTADRMIRETFWNYYSRNYAALA